MNDRYASVNKYDQQIGTWETFGTKVASGSAGAVGMQVYSGGVNDVVYIIVTYVAGNPYLFKSDGGGGWVNLGSPSSNGVNPTLALSDDGTPYAAYLDTNNNYKIYLKKYSGGWVSQGGAISSSAPMDNNIALKIHGNIPYIAYCEYSVTNESWGAVKVKKYVSNSWQNVGSVADDGSGLSLDVFDDGSPDGVPYIAYADQSNSFELVVKMFNKSLNRWDQIGGYISTYPASASLFPGYSVIRVVEAGRPYVSYHYTTNPDPWALDKNTNAIVKKYE
jgi:hypothetical protein